MLMFVLIASGFTNKDLRQAFAVLLGRWPEDITPGRMSYELRRLRLHGLIERLPKTHRYCLTDEGLRTALFYTRVYSPILRPTMAPIIPRPTMAPIIPTIPAQPLASIQHFLAAEAAIHSWCEPALLQSVNERHFQTIEGTVRVYSPASTPQRCRLCRHQLGSGRHSRR